MKQADHCGTGKECESEELHFRRGLPLACRVMCFASCINLHSEDKADKSDTQCRDGSSQNQTDSITVS